MAKLLCVCACLFSVGAIKVSLDEDANCACLPWKEAYASHGADCSFLGNERCNNFFMRIPNETFCVNQGMDKESPKQWCYASPKCSKSEQYKASWKGEFNKVAAKFRWCSEDEHTLGKFTMMELADWCKTNDLDIAWAAVMAFPALQHGLAWPDVVKYLGVTVPGKRAQAGQPLNPDQIAILQNMIDSGKPTFIGNRCKKPPCSNAPYLVVEGKKVYWINYGPASEEAVAKHNRLPENPSDTFKFACVVGCDTTSAPWMSTVNALDPTR